MKTADSIFFGIWPLNVVSPILCPIELFMSPLKGATPTSLDHTNYRIGRGEIGVLTYEPYKSALLPLWRFRTPQIARTSSIALWNAFLEYEEKKDFVGMDMSRKFLQMGMTRAKRYANHQGGKKYKSDVEGAVKKNKEVIEVSADQDWKGRKEKEEASAIFREVWERARDYEPYQEMKKDFLRQQKAWGESQKKCLMHRI